MTSKHKTWIQIIISATMIWLKSHRRQIEDVDRTVRSVPISSLSPSLSTPIDSYVLFLSCPMIMYVEAEYRLMSVLRLWRKKSAHRHLEIITVLEDWEVNTSNHHKGKVKVGMSLFLSFWSDADDLGNWTKHP